MISWAAPSLLLLSLVLTQAPSAGQVPTRPAPREFSGRWVLRPPVPESRPQLCGRGCSIEQTEKDIVVTEDQGAASMIPIVGPPAVTKIVVGDQEATMSVSAKWQGDALVVTRSTQSRSQVVTTTVTLSRSGEALVIESSPYGRVPALKLEYGRAAK